MRQVFSKVLKSYNPCVGQRGPLLCGEDGQLLRQECPEEEAGAAPHPGEHGQLLREVGPVKVA